MADRWTSISQTALKTGKISVVLARVQAIATARSESDPVPELIADVVATLRAAVSAGNDLDTDATKVPGSLKALAIRMVLRRAQSYLELPLTKDDATQAEEDAGYLRRIIDAKIAFEKPDDAGGAAAQMQSKGGIDVQTSTNRDQYTRAGLNGL